MRIAESYYRRLLFETDPSQAVGHLANLWSTRAVEGDPFLGLNRVEFNVHLALWYFAEVGNGGHFQYFFNPIGRFALQTRDALKATGLQAAAEVLAQAIAVWPGEIPLDALLRQSQIESLPQASLQLWHRLDRDLQLMSDYCDQLLMYLRDNSSEVLAPERSPSQQ